MISNQQQAIRLHILIMSILNTYFQKVTRHEIFANMAYLNTYIKLISVHTEICWWLARLVRKT